MTTCSKTAASDCMPQEANASRDTDWRKKRRKKSRRVKSYEAIRRLVRLANDCSPRPVDARWQITVSIAQREATQHFFRAMMNRDTKRALRYVKHCLRKGRPDPGRFADVHCAWLLRFEAGRLRRATLEARLLARQTIEETAAACKLPAEIVRLYESLFFCVLDKLDHPLFIIPEAISPRFWSGFRAEDIDILIKFMAYQKGPIYLDYILPYFTTPSCIPNRLESLSAAQLANLQKRISIRAVIDSLTMSSRQALLAFNRCATTELSTQWHALAQELQVLATAAYDQEIEQRRLITDVSSLLPTSVARLMASYRVEPAARLCNIIPGPVSQVG